MARAAPALSACFSRHLAGFSLPQLMKKRGLSSGGVGE
jgi:hypothetical protein